ncbi:MAG: hypothetical protein GY729_07430, partial [Desulfobacteraceae bacterium]|nr:hypothetical protein [Desulfobacteraceae bacterium]
MRDYEKYLDGKSLKDLTEINQSIDREKHPDKYACLIKAIHKEEDRVKTKQISEEEVAPLIESEEEVTPPISMTNQVKAELENIVNPKKNIGTNLWILVLSIFLFASLGFF